jgi:hypothetical protein
VRASEFDEPEFFRAVQDSGRRALLIGRRALVVLGLPVLTADYDFWVIGDEVPRLNEACPRFDLHPSKTVEEARRTGRYVLENDERVDVLVARTMTARTGEVADFEAVWSRRLAVDLMPGVQANLPSIEDLILTKRFALRPKDVEDIRMLETLRGRA